MKICWEINDKDLLKAKWILGKKKYKISRIDNQKKR